MIAAPTWKSGFKADKALGLDTQENASGRADEVRAHGFYDQSLSVAGQSRRIEAVDFARGIAIVLMILSHGVKGLLSLDQIPQWGLVPIHLITKFSSSLFIIVFGISLSVAFTPYIGTEKWKAKREKLLVRGLLVFFWYKVLTIVEMVPLYSREDILKTLTYQAFPVYVEILGFYAIALMWTPFFLPAWKKLHLSLQILLIVGISALGHYLFMNFDFWGNDVLKAVLVEHDDHYTWGQLARAPLILVGLMVGAAFATHYPVFKNRMILGATLLAVSVTLFTGFFALAYPDLMSAFDSVARNEGKHPPAPLFMFFSLGGAFAILALAVLGGEKLARIVRPITIIGQDSLHAFIFHIFVIFVFYRYLFDYWKQVPYGYALTLTLILIGMTAAWVKVSSWVRRKA